VCAVLQVAVPTLLQLWLPQLRQHKGQLSLQQMVSSGEGLTAALAHDLFEALPPGCSLVNLYGECLVPCWVLLCDVCLAATCLALS
jgi:non-ribosomal peptide synthetase component F